MNVQEITTKLKTLPRRSGVYLMKNRDGEIIYIGKAKVLRSRVRSYFQEGADDGRHQFRALVSHIATLDYIVTDTEIEALILEANLIKEHKPRYNINLKDDKKYPFLKITKEPYPRLIVTRMLEKGGGRYFGPYTDIRAMRSTLEIVQRIFPIRDCAYALPTRRPERVCLSHHIHRCQGPCQGLVSEEEYNRMIDQVALFLTGRNETLVRTLKEKMEEAAVAQQFEHAAVYRDRLRDVERTISRQKVAIARMEDWDILTVAREDDEACGLIMEIREGKLLGKKHYVLNGVIESSTEEIVSAFLRQFYVGAVWIPREIHLPCDIEDRETVEAWLSEQRGEKVEIKIPQRGTKSKLMELALQNAELVLAERRFKRERLKEKVPHNVAALQRDLHLEHPPRRIEAVDISILQGTDAVGSLVCFVDGKPKKSDYRRFKIRTVEGQDDTAMMREVVVRHFKRLQEEEGERPGLLLVDGGKGQLSSAVEALNTLGITDQIVIGLAKRLEEVFFPGVSDPQMIPKASSSLKLLQHIRNEAHRFAVTYHRTLRDRRTTASALDRIPGIGPTRKRALLRAFGSVKQIAGASLEDIAAVEGIGSKTAKVIQLNLTRNHKKAEDIGE